LQQKASNEGLNGLTQRVGAVESELGQKAHEERVLLLDARMHHVEMDLYWKASAKELQNLVKRV
jgi:hypothetical protein